jgi:hypothetical protein
LGYSPRQDFAAGLEDFPELAALERLVWIMPGLWSIVPPSPGRVEKSLSVRCFILVGGVQLTYGNLLLCRFPNMIDNFMFQDGN